MLALLATKLNSLISIKKCVVIVVVVGVVVSLGPIALQLRTYVLRNDVFIVVVVDVDVHFGELL